MDNFINVPKILKSLAIDPSTAADPVKRMFIFDGEHLTANIATGGEAGSALHTQLAHDEIIIVLEGEAEFQVGDEIKHVAPGDIVFIPQNTLHDACGLRPLSGQHYRSTDRTSIAAKRTSSGLRPNP